MLSDVFLLLVTDRNRKERVEDGVHAGCITRGRVGQAWGKCDKKDATIESGGFL